MMQEELQISLSTLIEVSTMLGLHLEDFSRIRRRQQIEVVKELQQRSTSTLNEPHQKKHYYLSALDFLVYEKDGNKKFKFTEINGSGFTGISNISEFAQKAIFNELTKMPDYINDEMPVIAIPCSGTKEISTSGRPSLMYEKILFAQSIKDGFKKAYGEADLVTLYDIINLKKFDPKKPTVVIGYLMDLMKYLSCINGKIHLLDVPLTGATHDRFCDNVANTYKDCIDLNKFYSANNLFYITADKGNAYTYFRDFRETMDFSSFDRTFDFTRVFNREELIAGVLERMKAGKRTVIKPHGAALGRGIEFFVKQEPEEIVIDKIDSSLHAVNRFCGVEGWAFPYTIVNFVDCSTIVDPNYPLFGHKFEMRVIVYREGTEIKAFPSIVKISSKKYEPDISDRLMLLNNVAAAAGRTKLDSFHYMLPLTNTDTWQILGLDFDKMAELCSFCTNYVRYAINRVDTNPISLKENYCSSLVSPG